jgi:hypothetical protein
LNFHDSLVSSIRLYENIEIIFILLIIDFLLDFTPLAVGNYSFVGLKLF